MARYWPPAVLAAAAVVAAAPAAQAISLFLNDESGFTSSLTVNPSSTLTDTDDAFALDPTVSTGNASVTRSGTIAGEAFAYTIYDFDFSNSPTGTLTPGRIGGDIAGLDTIAVERRVSQDGAVGTGSWGVDTVTGSNLTRNALLFDFTMTPGDQGIGHFGLDLHDVESSIDGRSAEARIYRGGNLVATRSLDFGNDGNGMTNFLGIAANGPGDFFDQVAVVVGDDDLGGEGFRERLAADRFTFGSAAAVPEAESGALVIMGVAIALLAFTRRYRNRGPIHSK